MTAFYSLQRFANHKAKEYLGTAMALTPNYEGISRSGLESKSQIVIYEIQYVVKIHMQYVHDMNT